MATMIILHLMDFGLNSQQMITITSQKQYVSLQQTTSYV
jgi:hypothetical protein